MELGPKQQTFRIDKVFLEPYQYLVHFGVANWGKDRANNDLSVDSKTDVLAHFYQADTVGLKQTILHHTKSLVNRNVKITRTVASVADPHKEWLLPKIEIVISQYEVDKLGLPPRPGKNV